MTPPTQPSPVASRIKLFPCCYALQRPIAALAALDPAPAERVRRIQVRTPASSLTPLIHHAPRTGLEGKFSLEYGIAAALLDGPPGFDSFTDTAVRRPAAARLSAAVETTTTTGDSDHLLAGDVEIELTFEDGTNATATLALPPGAPERPVTDDELRSKLELCAGDESQALAAVSWETAAGYVRSRLTA